MLITVDFLFEFSFEFSISLWYFERVEFFVRNFYFIENIVLENYIY